jgi:hypothetical protein
MVGVTSSILVPPTKLIAFARQLLARKAVAHSSPEGRLAGRPSAFSAPRFSFSSDTLPLGSATRVAGIGEAQIQLADSRCQMYVTSLVQDGFPAPGTV